MPSISTRETPLSARRYRKSAPLTHATPRSAASSAGPTRALFTTRSPVSAASSLDALSSQDTSLSLSLWTLLSSPLYSMLSSLDSKSAEFAISPSSDVGQPKTTGSCDDLSPLGVQVGSFDWALLIQVLPRAAAHFVLFAFDFRMRARPFWLVFLSPSRLKPADSGRTQKIT
jgi:hypothetical protein